MILVDVKVPALDRVYDFELEEEMTAGKLTEEIITLIHQQERIGAKQTEEMLLYGMRQEKILNRNLTLKQMGVTTGDELILL